MRREQIQMIRRVDQMIRLRATGNYRTFSERLEVSPATLFRLIDHLKYEFEAPIRYNRDRETYEYAIKGRIELGFKEDE